MAYNTYENYKASGINWIGEIPIQWDVFKLKHVINEFISGGTPKTSEDSYWDYENKGIPWVAIGDMSNYDFVDSTSKSLTMEGVIDKNLRILPKGTLIYSIFASLGNVSILNISATTNQAILGLLISKKVNKFFLKYYLEALREHILAYSNANTQNNLNSTTVKNIDITLPRDIQEQELIVDFLDKKTSEIDENIAKNKELISLLEEKKTALINQVVTKGLDPNVPMKESSMMWIDRIPIHWEETKLKYISTKVSKSAKKEDEMLVCSNSGKVIFKKDSKSGLVTEKEEKLQKVEKGDLLIHGMDTWHGAIAISDYDGKCSPVVHVCKSKEDNRYLKYYLQVLAFRNVYKAISNGIRENTSDFRSWEKTGSIPIILPPLKEQIAISNYLDDEISKMEFNTQKMSEKIDLLEEYKTSLIHHTVTGKIDVRDEI